MNWSQIITQFAAQLAASGVALAAAIYLLKSLVTQQLAKNLEAFKHSLAVKVEHDRVQFSKLHERRAEIIEAVYQRLVLIVGLLRRPCVPSTATEGTADQLNVEIVEVIHYFGRHALYFTPATKEKFQRVFLNGLPRALLMRRGIDELQAFEAICKERLGRDVALAEPFMDGLRQQLPVLTELVLELEADFQNILGMANDTITRRSLS